MEKIKIMLKNNPPLSNFASKEIKKVTFFLQIKTKTTFKPFLRS